MYLCRVPSENVDWLGWLLLLLFLLGAVGGEHDVLKYSCLYILQLCRW